MSTTTVICLDVLCYSHETPRHLTNTSRGELLVSVGGPGLAQTSRPSFVRTSDPRLCLGDLAELDCESRFFENAATDGKGGHASDAIPSPTPASAARSNLRPGPLRIAAERSRESNPLLITESATSSDF